MTTHVFGYGQASFDPAVPSTAEQEAFVSQSCAARIQSGRLPPGSYWAGFVRDEATQKPVKFRNRPNASLLLAALIRPHHVVIAAGHDRIFANVVDACEVLEFSHDMGFRLITLDHGIDTAEPTELLMPLSATMRSLRQRERRRTKEEFELRKRCGMPAGGKCPIGWEIVRAGLDGTDRAYFVPNHDARRVAQYLVEHHDQWAHTKAGTFEQTAYWLNAQRFYRPDGRPWRRTAVMNWYYAAKDGFPLPNGRRDAFPIPVGARSGAAHRRIEDDN